MTNDDRNTAADLDLIALMVARRLRDRQAQAPKRAAYSILATGRYGEGRPDLHVRVELGRGLVVRVEEPAVDMGDAFLTTMARTVEDLAVAIENVITSAADTRDMLREVAAAVRREISKANRRELPWRLIDVEPCPILVSYPNARPTVMVRMHFPGRTPMPELSFVTCRADHAAEKLSDLRKEQTW